MVHYFIELLRDGLSPYGGNIIFLNLYLWQYATFLLLISATLGAIRLALLILTWLFSFWEGELAFFDKFKRRLYWLGVTGVLLYAKSTLALPTTVFWQYSVVGLSIIFMILSFLVMNKWMDIMFMILNRRMQSAGWDEVGILQVLKSIAKIAIFLFLIPLLSLFFLDYNLGTWLKSFSIGAGTLTAVIALASKDLISNFFGALVVTVGRPFKVGDWVVVNGLEGWIVGIGMRATLLKTLSGVTVYIPNSTFISKHVHNYGAAIYMPFSFSFSLKDVDGDKVHDFLAGVRTLLAGDDKIKRKRSHLVVKDMNFEKMNCVLHLYFDKMKEEDRGMYMRLFIEKIRALGVSKGITLID